MRIRHLVCIGAVLVLTACGGGGSDDDSKKPAAKKTSAAASIPPLSEADAKKALLTVKDLPEGWKVDPDDDSGDDVKVTKGSKACKEMVDDDDDDAPTKVETSFTLEDEAFLSSTIESYDSADAKKEWDADLEMLDGCRRFTMGDSDGFSIELRVRTTQIDDLGDDAALMYATGTVQGVRMHMDILGVREGRNVVGVSALAFGERAPREQLKILAKVVQDRLDRLEDTA
jgi:hypothetical protein